jgi:hypothetical protein
MSWPNRLSATNRKWRYRNREGKVCDGNFGRSIISETTFIEAIRAKDEETRKELELETRKR